MARFEVFRDRAGKYRWRLKAGNGEKVATSGESFATRSNASRATRAVKRNARVATTP